MHFSLEYIVCTKDDIGYFCGIITVKGEELQSQNNLPTY